MTARHRLPNRRASELFDFEHAGQRYTLGISRFANGQLAEVFINSRGKSGSSAETSAKDAAIAASLALQHGADADAIRRALCRDPNGRPCGPLGCALDIVCSNGGRQ
jgi:hypothetical protein